MFFLSGETERSTSPRRPLCVSVACCIICRGTSRLLQRKKYVKYLSEGFESSRPPPPQPHRFIWLYLHSCSYPRFRFQISDFVVIKHVEDTPSLSTAHFQIFFGCFLCASLSDIVQLHIFIVLYSSPFFLLIFTR